MDIFKWNSSSCGVMTEIRFERNKPWHLSSLERLICVTRRSAAYRTSKYPNMTQQTLVRARKTCKHNGCIPFRRVSSRDLVLYRPPKWNRGIFNNSDCTCFSCYSKPKVLLITITMALFYPGVPVNHDSVTVSQHAQYQDPDTEAAKWNSAIINLIIYTCERPTDSK